MTLKQAIEYALTDCGHQITAGRKTRTEEVKEELGDKMSLKLQQDLREYLETKEKLEEAQSCLSSRNNEMNRLATKRIEETEIDSLVAELIKHENWLQSCEETVKQAEEQLHIAELKLRDEIPIANAWFQITLNGKDVRAVAKAWKQRESEYEIIIEHWRDDLPNVGNVGPSIDKDAIHRLASQQRHS